MDLLVTGAAVGLLSAAAYAVGRVRTSAEGCNGHHWTDPHRMSILNHGEGDDVVRSDDTWRISGGEEYVPLRWRVRWECEDCGKAKHTFERWVDINNDGEIVNEYDPKET